MSELGTSWAYPLVKASVEVVRRLEHDPISIDRGDASTTTAGSAKRSAKVDASETGERMAEDEGRARRGGEGSV